MDFLRQQDIVTGLTASTKSEAFARLVDWMIESHRLDDTHRDPLLAAVIAREAEFSTCFGNGIAVPHGELVGGASVIGVMGLSKDGMPFETPDNRPIHCMILLATPPDQRAVHLQALAVIARTLGTDATTREKLFQVDSPGAAIQLLKGRVDLEQSER